MIISNYRNDEHALMISCLLEAIFLHGYHDHGVKVSPPECLACTFLVYSL